MAWEEQFKEFADLHKRQVKEDEERQAAKREEEKRQRKDREIVIRDFSALVRDICKKCAKIAGWYFEKKDDCTFLIWIKKSWSWYENAYPDPIKIEIQEYTNYVYSPCVKVSRNSGEDPIMISLGFFTEDALVEAIKKHSRIS